MASAISVVSERLEPWSGRSDAIRNSGSVSPFLIGPHEAEGSAVAPPPPSPSSSPPHPAAANARTPMTPASTTKNPDFLTCTILLRHQWPWSAESRLPPTSRQVSGEPARLATQRGPSSRLQLFPEGAATMGRAPKWRNWQTRRTQNPVGETPCGFKSHLRHSSRQPAARFPRQNREVKPELPVMTTA